MKCLRIRRAEILFLSLVFFWPSVCFSMPQSPTDISREDPAHGASRKLGRGLANVGLGWVEFFKGIQSVGEEKGFWAGATWGPLYGAVNAARRTAIGVGETLTFPAPGRNNYEPILEPEFVLENMHS